MRKTTEPLNLNFHSLSLRRKVGLDLKKRKDRSDYQLHERSNNNYIRWQSVVTELVVTEHREFMVPYVDTYPQLSQQTNEPLKWPSILEDDALEILTSENLRLEKKIQELQLEVEKPRNVQKHPSKVRRQSRCKSDLQVKIDVLKNTLRANPIQGSNLFGRTLSDMSPKCMVEESSRIEKLASVDSEEPLVMTPLRFTRSVEQARDQRKEKKPEGYSPERSKKWSCTGLTLL